LGPDYCEHKPLGSPEHVPWFSDQKLYYFSTRMLYWCCQWKIYEFMLNYFLY